jgi:nucleoid-associated protein YgaU
MIVRRTEFGGQFLSTFLRSKTMKAFAATLVAFSTIGMVGFAATTAQACHGGGGYGGYGGYSSHYYPEYERPVYVRESAPTFAPAHSLIVVMPGDSWSSICSREYGNPSMWRKVAEFNRIPRNEQLRGGMQLRLPVLSPNGGMTLSSAPAAIGPGAQGFNGGIPQGLPQGGQFAQQGRFPQGNGFAPQGQGFGQPAAQFGQQGGLPPGAQFGQQGMQQPNGFAPQGQGFGGQQFPNGFPQGAQGGPQGPMNLPQGGQFGPQGGQAEQQGPMGLPEGAQPGQQVQQGQPMGPVGPQGPIGPQGPEGQAKDAGSLAGRILDQLTGLPGQANEQHAGPNGPGAPNGPNAAPGNRPVPSILIGSIMSINGQQLGDNRGTVRLIVNGSPVALEIVEWSASGAKVRIPADLPVGSQAQIEILRADGSVVAKDAVQLAAGQKVAATN